MRLKLRLVRIDGCHQSSELVEPEDCFESVGLENSTLVRLSDESGLVIDQVGAQ